MTDRTPDHSDISYKYYTLGENAPVRVKFNEAGLKINAEVPDPETQSLKIQTTLLSRLEKSSDTQEIDQETFDQMCKDIYAQANNNGRNHRFPH